MLGEREPGRIVQSVAGLTQESEVPAVGAGGGCLDIFSLSYHFSSFSLSLRDDLI